MLRIPLLVAGLHNELQVSQKNVIFNGKRYGCVWSLKADLRKVPDAFHYRMVTRIRRQEPGGVSAAPYQQIAKEVKAPRERIAADVLRLRKAGMRSVTSETDVFDTLTGTTRRVPVYH